MHIPALDDDEDDYPPYESTGLGQWESGLSLVSQIAASRSPAAKAAAHQAEVEARMQAKAAQLGISLALLQQLRSEARSRGMTTDALIQERGGIEAVRAMSSMMVPAGAASQAYVGTGTPTGVGWGWLLPAGLLAVGGLLFGPKILRALRG
jgi:hypothetical protein